MSHKAAFFNFERWGAKEKEYVRSSDKLKEAGVAVTFVDGIINSEHIPKGADFDILCVFMDSTVDAEIISALPSVKFIATLSTGFDHIDLVAAVGRDIPVSSVPAYGENTVAEFAFALMLNLARKLTAAQARVREEKIFTTDDLVGFDLAGKTLGVIGTGRIGKHAIRIGKGFGMNILAYDVYHDDVFATEMGFPYVPLNELLEQSDIITIHCPYLPSTHHLINGKNINLIKAGAYLINTARGAVVETAALIDGLRSGRLGGAGLDVLEEEALIKAGDTSIDRDLITMPNVIVTPHDAFNTREAFLRILDTTIDNIVAFTRGMPINLVKPVASTELVPEKPALDLETC